MTLRSMTEDLLKQMQQKIDYFDFRRESPLLVILPPKVVKVLVEANPQQETRIYGEYQASFFADLDDVKKLVPELYVMRGHPWTVGQFLTGQDPEILLDFFPLGLVLLSNHRNFKFPPSVYQAALANWMDYALSPELWGSNGKWIRFHQRLHTLFTNNHLLNGIDIPGLYPLAAKKIDWQKFSIKGDLRGENLELTIPWTFPLSALEDLERQLRQEL